MNRRTEGRVELATIGCRIAGSIGHFLYSNWVGNTIKKYSLQCNLFKGLLSVNSVTELVWLVPESSPYQLVAPGDSDAHSTF